MQVATASTPDPVPNDVKEAVSPIEIDECPATDNCIDRYLWALYQRTPKVDIVKVPEQRKVTVRRKGKTVTVIKNFTSLVDEDFAWKDPKAAEKAGMPMMDYVIGGMDRSFKLKLFYALRAAEEAGMSPGITSAFRDDYRQSIASGLRAATDRSYHGGSFRRGYGHGLAADVVSINGATEAQRLISNESLWKWIDAHRKEFEIGRPYLDKRSAASGADRRQGICRSPRDKSPIRGIGYEEITSGWLCGSITALRKRPGNARWQRSNAAKSNPDKWLGGLEH